MPLPNPEYRINQVAGQHVQVLCASCGWGRCVDSATEPPCEANGNLWTVRVGKCPNCTSQAGARGYEKGYREGWQEGDNNSGHRQNVREAATELRAKYEAAQEPKPPPRRKT